MLLSVPQRILIGHVGQDIANTTPKIHMRHQVSIKQELDSQKLFSIFNIKLFLYFANCGIMKHELVVYPLLKIKARLFCQLLLFCSADWTDR